MRPPLPNVAIVGVNKAGTTSLFATLAARPDVCGSAVKETHFFDPLRFGEPLGSLEEYRRCFSQYRGEPVVMEGTPGYFYGGRPMAEHLAEVLDDLKIVIVLREPGARAFSWYRFARSRLMIPQELDFEGYLAACAPLGLSPELTRDTVGLRGLSGGHYVHWLPAWQQVFGDRLFLTCFEDLTQRFDETYARLLAFLDLPPGEPQRLASDNRTTDVNRAGLQRLALRVNRRGESFLRRHPRLKSTARSLYYRSNAKQTQESMTPSARRWLDEHFREPDQRLAELLGDAAPQWAREHR